LLFEIDPLEATDIDEEPDFVLAETLHRMQREGLL
jgi:CMP-N-acetylneuraminic acid synthetase